VGALRLTAPQIAQLANKSNGYAKDTTFTLGPVSKCVYLEEGGYSVIHNTVFFTVINVEYEIFPDGTVIARNWKTGEVIE